MKCFLTVLNDRWEMGRISEEHVQVCQEPFPLTVSSANVKSEPVMTLHGFTLRGYSLLNFEVLTIGVGSSRLRYPASVPTSAKIQSAYEEQYKQKPEIFIIVHFSS